MIVKAGLQPLARQIMPYDFQAVFPDSFLKISKCILDLRMFKNIRLSLISGAIRQYCVHDLRLLTSAVTLSILRTNTTRVVSGL